jgi:hypothetical protein
VVVAAPLGLAEAGVAAQCYPICDHAYQGVLGG